MRGDGRSLSTGESMRKEDRAWRSRRLMIPIHLSSSVHNEINSKRSVYYYINTQ